jgi:hypothetical protein
LNDRFGIDGSHSSDVCWSYARKLVTGMKG